jgi:hypothetical protein
MQPGLGLYERNASTGYPVAGEGLTMSKPTKTEAELIAMA